MAQDQEGPVTPGSSVVFVSGGLLKRLPEDLVVNFSIGASLDTGFPVGELYLDDSDGKILNGLLVAPGDLFYAMSASSSSKITESTPLLVVGIDTIEDDGSITGNSAPRSLAGTYSGLIKLTLAHPWVALNNSSNEAYKGTTTEIITSLITNARKRSKLPLIIGDLGKQVQVDQNEVLIRYRIDKSEIKFIIEDLLPFTTINAKPCYFFIDDIGKLNLTTFDIMFKKPSKVVFIPPMNQLGVEGFVLPKKKEKEQFVEVVDVKLKIGANFTKQILRLKQNFRVVDSITNTTLKLNHFAKPQNDGIVLIKKQFLADASGTKSTSYDYRIAKEYLFKQTNTVKELDKFLEVEVITAYCFSAVCVGDTATLNLFAKFGSAWANGKYVVSETNHYKRGSKLFSKFTLIKPTIDLDELKNEMGIKEFSKELGKLFEDCVDLANI